MRRSSLFVLIAIPVLICLLVSLAGVYVLVAPNFKPTENYDLYIRPETNFNKLCTELKDSANCLNIRSFMLIANILKYPNNIKTGHYSIEPGMSNLDALKMLRRGTQSPVRITFNNIRLPRDLANRLGEQLMLDGDDVYSLISDTNYCTSMGFTPQTIIAIFIPNTYEMYWNVSAETLMQRMKREYAAFWNDTRQVQAQKIGLTPVEVSILASIIEEESAATDEYPTIAGLYINRLRRNIPLQADPTVKFAVGDFSLQRILNEHLETDSPYNTYLHTGLPPGPLRIPSITGLEAVLNFKQHNYLYMCAKEDFSGRHNFATNLADHNRNAERYRDALNRRGIR